MVYESDFYTSRRPYARPNITSYSVTLVPHFGGLVRATPGIPHIAHQRLTPHIVVVPNTWTRRSTLSAELDRINHRVRPRLSYVPREDFLNDPNIVSFDDETRNIRAQTNSLLRKVHEPLPRCRPHISLALTYNRPELAVPERITSDDYIHRMVETPRNVPYDISALSYYHGVDPTQRSNIGKGHLACVSYAGGKAYSRRPQRELYSDNKSIKDEITFRSYYKALDKPGQASEGPKEEAVAP